MLNERAKKASTEAEEQAERRNGDQLKGLLHKFHPGPGKKATSVHSLPNLAALASAEIDSRQHQRGKHNKYSFQQMEVGLAKNLPGPLTIPT